jgi:tungstate transport system substrate-binding protein
MNRLCLFCMLVLLAAIGCSQQASQNEAITLATTTSTQDSGLLDILVPIFRQQTGIEVKVVAVGTGQALQLGRRGDADVLLVHDPQAEGQFMAEGHGVERRPVMFNDFVLVGPKADPANVRGQRSIAEAYSRIARSGSPFVSRGDESGTHQKEREVWGKAGVDPQGGWYIRAGAGMGQVLRMADEKHAYTLADRGTFLAQREGLDLTILSEGDPILVNQYSVLLLSHDKHPHVRHQAARKFAEFLLSPQAQNSIAVFGKDKFGQALFCAGTARKEAGR